MRAHGNGFTLLEILLAVAFITALAAIPLLFAPTLMEKTDLRLSRTLIVHALHEARTRAAGGYHDDAWGVKVESGSVTVFEGPSFVGRVSGEDRVTAFPGDIAVGPVDEVVFGKFSGEPDDTGEIAISIGTQDPLLIAIGEKGAISN